MNTKRKGRGHTTRPPIDAGWFLDRMADAGLSQAQVARMIAPKLGRQYDPTALNKTLYGKRTMQMDEAAELARILGQPLTSVLARAGLDVPKESTRMVPVTGSVGAGGVVAKGAGGPARAPRPAGMPDSTEAVRVLGGDLAAGWICYYVPTSALDPAAVGRLAIVQIRGERERRLCILKHGFSAGRWNLEPLAGGEPTPDVTVVSAAPVLWVKTG